MKRLGQPMQRATGMTRMARPMMGMKPALSFIDGAPDPITEQPDDATHEQREAAAMSETLRGFKERAKAEQIRFAETTRTDFYCCVVFEHGDQLNAFLKATGYPDPSAMFVDGTILAKALDIEIPKSPFKLRPLKPPDRSLHGLVTMTNRIGMKRSTPVAPASKPKKG